MASFVFLLYLISSCRMSFCYFNSHSHSHSNLEPISNIHTIMEKEKYHSSTQHIPDHDSIMFYRSLQPSSHYTLQFNLLLKSETWLYLNNMIHELNKNVVEINNHFHDICYDFMNIDTIINERDIVRDISKQKYDTQQQNVNMAINKYNNPLYGISITSTDAAAYATSTIVDINDEGKALNEQDYFTIYKDKIIEGEIQMMNRLAMKQAYMKLCDTISPAPLFEIDIKKGFPFSTAKCFTLNTRFQDPTSISVLSAIIGKQMSIMKFILVERRDLSEFEKLSYTSQLERYEIFLEMLTMSSIFKVDEQMFVDVFGSTTMHHQLEITLHALEYAIYKYKSAINLLHKERFPIQTKKLEEYIQLTLANSRTQYKKDMMIFTNYLHYFKPIATSSWELGEYVQNNIMLAFHNINSRTIGPFIQFIDTICYRIVKLLIALFVVYLIVNLFGIFAPTVVQYGIQKIYQLYYYYYDYYYYYYDYYDNNRQIVDKTA